MLLLSANGFIYLYVKTLTFFIIALTEALRQLGMVKTTCLAKSGERPEDLRFTSRMRFRTKQSALSPPPIVLAFIHESKSDFSLTMLNLPPRRRESVTGRNG